jgi:hypothetical protein
VGSCSSHILIETLFTTLRVSLKKRGELSSSEDYFSCVYDSYVWQPDDDIITYLFEDDESWNF